MGSVVTFADLTEQVLAALRTSTGHQIGDGKAPGSDSDTLEHPYGILRRSAATDWQGAIGASGEMVRVTYEFTAVGKRRDQVERLADRAIVTILDRGPAGWVTPLVVPGLNVMDRRPGESPPQDREGRIVNDLRGFVLHVSVL